MKRKNKSTIPTKHSTQEDILDRFRPLLSSQEFSQLLAALEEPVFPSLRMNPLVTDPDSILNYSRRFGWQMEKVPFCPSGWWVKQAEVPISKTIEHRLGRYYIQDAASMLPAELFDIDHSKDSLTLDMAASPGGKTTHLVDRIGDKGLIIANDSSKNRITALRLVLQTWGASSTAITCFPGEQFGGWYSEVFDRVLLDAPCSMQGLRTTESHPMRPITDRERDKLAARQKQLLQSAFHALKVGGQVVYSTCTLTPEENEEVLESLIFKYPDAVEVIDLSQRLTVPAPALSRIGEREYPKQVTGAARLWPHVFRTAGFFAALIQKTGTVRDLQETPCPKRAWFETGLEPLSTSEVAALHHLMLDGYGFNLEDTIEQFDWALFRRFQSYVAIPRLLVSQFSDMPFFTAGLTIGEDTPSGFILSHEFACRFERGFKFGRHSLPPDRIKNWLRGEDLHGISIAASQPGRIILIEDEDGFFVGRGRAQMDRLKNLLPVRAIL